MMTKKQEQDYLDGLVHQALELTMIIGGEPEAESLADGLEVVVSERLATLQKRSVKPKKQKRWQTINERRLSQYIANNEN